MGLKIAIYRTKTLVIFLVFVLLFSAFFYYWSTSKPEYSGRTVTIKYDFPENSRLIRGFLHGSGYYFYQEQSGKLHIFDPADGIELLPEQGIFLRLVDHDERFGTFSSEQDGDIQGLIDLRDLSLHRTSIEEPLIILNKEEEPVLTLPRGLNRQAAYINSFMHKINLEESGERTTALRITSTLDNSLQFYTEISENVRSVWISDSDQEQTGVVTVYTTPNAADHGFVRIDCNTGKISVNPVPVWDSLSNTMRYFESQIYTTSIKKTVARDYSVVNEKSGYWEKFAKRVDHLSGDKDFQIRYLSPEGQKLSIVPVEDMDAYSRAKESFNFRNSVITLILIILLFVLLFTKLALRKYHLKMPPAQKYKYGIPLATKDLRTLTDGKILAEVLKSTGYNHQQKLAALEGSGIGELFLQEIYAETDDTTLKQALLKLSSDQAFLESAFPSGDGVLDHKIVNGSSNNSFLLDIVLHQSTSKYAESALNRLKDDDILIKIVQESTVDQLRNLAAAGMSSNAGINLSLKGVFSAVPYINNLTGLQEIAENSIDPAIRKEAADKLDQLKKAEEVQLEKNRKKEQQRILREQERRRRLDQAQAEQLRKGEKISGPGELFGTQTDKNIAVEYLKNLGEKAKKAKVYSIWSWVDSRNGKTCYQFIREIKESNIFEFDSPSHVTEKVMLYEQGTMRVAGRELADGQDWAQKESLAAEALSGGELEKSLSDAVEAEDLEKVAGLLKQGANPNAKGGRWEQPLLQLAGGTGNIALADLLIDAGADLNYQDAEGFSLVALVAHDRDRKDMVLHLIKRGADLYTETARGIPTHQIIKRHIPDIGI